MSTIIGTIPKEIYYVISDKHTFKLNYQTFDDIKEEEIECHITKVCDSEDSTEIRNAPFNSKIETKNNVPVNNLKIINSFPTSFGTHYSVLVDGTHLVEMRDDVILDVMQNSSIDDNGMINCQFIWGKVGGHLKLIRVGSKLHLDVQESHNKKFNPKISSNQLERGSIYRTRNGTTQIFIGHIRSSEYHHIYKDNKPIHFKYTTAPEQKFMLFAEVYGDEGLNVFNYDFSKYLEKDRVYFTAKKTHSFIEKVGSNHIEDNAIPHIRTIFKGKCADLLSKVNMTKTSYGIDSPSYVSYQICNNSVFLNMRGANIKEKVPLFDINKYLLLS